VQTNQILILLTITALLSFCRKSPSSSHAAGKDESRPTAGTESIPGFEMESSQTVEDIGKPTQVLASGARVAANGDTYSEPVTVRIKSLRSVEDGRVVDSLIYLGQGIEIETTIVATGEKVSDLDQPTQITLQVNLENLDKLDDVTVLGHTELSGESLFYENSALSFNVLSGSTSLAR
jgi:hypothetical protein